MTNFSDLFSSSGTATIIDTQTFTASGTWTKLAGVLPTDLVVIDMWGGGGSGAVFGDTSTTTTGAGGGGGAHNRVTFRGIDLSSSETVTVGSGGAAVSSTSMSSISGNTGGYSEFKGIRAYGGGGGGNVGYKYGGTGGGIYSAGLVGSSMITRGGYPYVLQPLPDVSISISAITDLCLFPGEWGGGFLYPTPSNIIPPVHGGAAAAGSIVARSSTWGGGAGGANDGYSSTWNTGGTSHFGGTGGTAPTPATNTSNANGAAGSARGGGGSGAKWGTTGTVTSGAGGRGEVVVTVIRGI